MTPQQEVWWYRCALGFFGSGVVFELSLLVRANSVLSFVGAAGLCVWNFAFAHHAWTKLHGAGSSPRGSR